jgi:hypothetical protein
MQGVLGGHGGSAQATLPCSPTGQLQLHCHYVMFTVSCLPELYDSPASLLHDAARAQHSTAGGDSSSSSSSSST